MIIFKALVIIMIFFLGCGKEDSAFEKIPPDYAKPSYAVIPTEQAQTAIQFIDITQNSGIDFVHETGAFGLKWMPETTGSGAGFLDYDNDDRPDILLVNSNYWPGHEKSESSPTQKLYRNLGNGKFQDVTAATGMNITLYGMGCAVADFDADGDSDIFLTAVGDNRLLRNDKKKFTDVTSAFGVAVNSGVAGEPPAWSTSAAWLDIDHDGWLDLFVCNYVKWSPETDLFTTLDGKTKSYATPQLYQGETCRLYRNLRGRGFKDITLEAGLFNPEGKSLGVAIADFNNDGWPDIFVSNDTQPNFLYINNQNSTFTEVGLQTGIGYDEFGRARAGMGVDIADISNSGKFSIVIGNFAREPLALFTQIQEGLFQDLAGSARLNKPSLLRLSFGVLFQDFDLDGYSDLFVANGHIEPEINRVQQDITFAQPSQLFVNNQKGQFVEISEQLKREAGEPIVGRGLATADIDGDGDLDVLITVNGGSPKLLRNELLQKQNNWIKFTLNGESPNHNAIGAKVVIWSGKLKQEKLVRTGSSYLSQSYTNELVFGIGEHDLVDSLEVRWPVRGRIDKHGQLAAKKSYILSEKRPVAIKKLYKL